MRIGEKIYYLSVNNVIFFGQNQNFPKIHKTEKKIYVAQTKNTCLIILTDKQNCQVSRILMNPRPFFLNRSENDFHQFRLVYSDSTNSK
jgi:hypothetical protein